MQNFPKINKTKSKNDLIERLKDLKSQMDKIIQKQYHKELQNQKKVTSSTLSFGQGSSRMKSDIQNIRQNIIGLASQFMNSDTMWLQYMDMSQQSISLRYQKIQDMITHIQKNQINSCNQNNFRQQSKKKILTFSNNIILTTLNGSTNKYSIIIDDKNEEPTIFKMISFIQKTQKQHIFGEIFLFAFFKQQTQKQVVNFKLTNPYRYNAYLLDNQAQTNIFDKFQKQIKISNPKFAILFFQPSPLTPKSLLRVNQRSKKLRKQTETVFYLCADFSDFCQQVNLQLLNQIDLSYFTPCNKLGGLEGAPFFVAKNKMGKQINETTESKQIVYKNQVSIQSVIKLYKSALCFQLLKTEIGYSLINQRQQINNKLFTEIIEEKNNFFKSLNIGKVINISQQPIENNKKHIFYFEITCNNQPADHKFVFLVLVHVFGININLKTQIKQQKSQCKTNYLTINIPFYLQSFEVEYAANAICFIAQQYSNAKYHDFQKQNRLLNGHKIENNAQKQKYGLSHLLKAKNTLKKNCLLNKILLKNRKWCLEEQLKNGKQYFTCKFANPESSAF